jgi:hypothetical protein
MSAAISILLLVRNRYVSNVNDFRKSWIRSNLTFLHSLGCFVFLMAMEGMGLQRLPAGKIFLPIRLMKRTSWFYPVWVTLNMLGFWWCDDLYVELMMLLLCRILLENVANILSQRETIERVLTCGNASDVLKCAFSLTEAALNHQYEVFLLSGFLAYFMHFSIVKFPACCL